MKTRVITVLLALIALFAVITTGCAKEAEKEETKDTTAISEPSEKIFSEIGMNITLTDRFSIYGENSESSVKLIGGDVVVAIKKVLKSEYDGKVIPQSVSEYAGQLVENGTFDEVSEITENEGLVYYEYTITDNENSNKFKYLVSVYENDDAFWIVQFGCNESLYQENRNDMLKYAKSVAFLQT